ncbi:MAG TPA: PAC2 family protein [Candidatus Nanoarchaeia archaeon]|nr:PAC2 family protein [Candidatus Nanoarchaeia archaeon]
MSWKFEQLSNPVLKKPILIEGLPGMGNVGKIAVDFLIDALGAKKLFEITSYQLPHCVFVNDENMVELPEIEVYYKNVGDRTLLFLAGDIQPINEQSCYEFCHAILDQFQKRKVQEIITLGGIALPKVPQNPKVFCAGNSKKLLRRYEKSRLVHMNTSSVVGPIMGVSGLLTGLAGKRNIPAVSLLAETFAHPNYVGVDGAKELLRVLCKQLSIKVDIARLDEEFKDIPQDMGIKPKHMKLKKEVVEPKDVEERQDYFG